MNRKLLLPLLMIAATSLPAHAAKHPSLPAIFGTAHTVFVESLDGDITNLKLDPADRAAILNTQDGIQAWPRYTLSRSRTDADLIFVVHKGRLVPNASDYGGLRGPSNSPNPSNLPSPSSHAPLGDPGDASQNPGSPNGKFTQQKDQLQVFTLDPNGKLKDPIWTSDQDHGLDSPQVHLLKRLREDIEKAYPTLPSNKP